MREGWQSSLSLFIPSLLFLFSEKGSKTWPDACEIDKGQMPGSSSTTLMFIKQINIRVCKYTTSGDLKKADLKKVQ